MSRRYIPRDAFEKAARTVLADQSKPVGYMRTHPVTKDLIERVFSPNKPIALTEIHPGLKKGSKS